MDAVTLGAAQSYTDEAMKGMGALKGKNCTIESITELEKEMAGDLKHEPEENSAGSAESK